MADDREAAAERDRFLAMMSDHARSRVRSIREAAERQKEQLAKEQEERRERDMESARQDVLTPPPEPEPAPGWARRRGHKKPPSRVVEEQAKALVDRRNQMQRDAIEQRTVRQIDEVLQLERLMKSPSIEPAGRDQLGRLWAAQARDAGGEVEQKEQEDPEPGLEERDLDGPEREP